MKAHRNVAYQKRVTNEFILERKKERENTVQYSAVQSNILYCIILQHNKVRLGHTDREKCSKVQCYLTVLDIEENITM